MKKGRHRRFEEARSLKRSFEGSDILIGQKAQGEECAECGAIAGKPHAEWCLAESEELEYEDDLNPTGDIN